MSHADWQKAKAIFNSALELRPDARTEYLAAACGGDGSLRGQVEELLASYHTDFLELTAAARSGAADIDLRSDVLRPGQKIGRYEVVKLIGIGGMGEVYLARDESLDRPVCLKVFSSDAMRRDDHLERFVREARSASALNHPHICTVYEINTEHDPPFIALEYVEGRTLAEKIARGKFDPGTAVDIALQIADGLAEAHDAGIVHRDIKPANIIINKRGQVKIVDFGIAKKFTAPPDEHTQKALTHSGMIVGTVSYMSPEQARGQAVDERTDVWSLGVVLYEMLTGKLPFAGDTVGDVIASILRSEPEIGRDLANLPEDLEPVFRKALSKEKDSRYPTVRHLAADLQKVKAKIPGSDGAFHPQNESTLTLPRLTGNEPASPTIGAGGRRRWQNALKPRLLLPAVFVLAVLGLGAWYFGYSKTGRMPINSIAVMPFENSSGNADAEYLSDGLTESLIGRLSTLPGISVKARSSVFRYKGRSPDPKTVGSDLGVQAVVNGRILKRDTDFALYVELVDTATENVLWKGEYNRPTASLVSVQPEIVRDVLANLRVKLSGTEVQNATRNYTDNAEAYQLYLKGRYYWDKRNEEAYKVAIEAYSQAIALDPDYALAYAGLADCYLFREVGLGRDVAMPKAKEYALKALELDESLAEAHTTLAFVNANYDLDFSSGEKEFKRAIGLKPNYATAHQFYGALLFATGRTDEALAEMRRAVELEPYAATVNWSLGLGLGFAHRYDESIVQLEKTLQILPNFALAEEYLVGMFILTNRFDDATALVQKHLAMPERRNGALSNLAIIYAKTGREKEARKTLDELSGESKSQNNPYNMARVYAALRENDKAMEWLNKALERRSFSIWFLRVDPFFDSLHDDPRFQELVRRIGSSA